MSFDIIDVDIVAPGILIIFKFFGAYQRYNLKFENFEEMIKRIRKLVTKSNR